MTTGTQANGEVTFQLPEDTPLDTFDVQIQYINNGVELTASNSATEPFVVEEPELAYLGFSYASDDRSIITLQFEALTDDDTISIRNGGQSFCEDVAFDGQTAQCSMEARFLPSEVTVIANGETLECQGRNDNLCEIDNFEYTPVFPAEISQGEEVKLSIDPLPTNPDQATVEFEGQDPISAAIEGNEIVFTVPDFYATGEFSGSVFLGSKQFESTSVSVIKESPKYSGLEQGASNAEVVFYFTGREASDTVVIESTNGPICGGAIDETDRITCTLPETYLPEEFTVTIDGNSASCQGQGFDCIFSNYEADFVIPDFHRLGQVNKIPINPIPSNAEKVEFDYEFLGRIFEGEIIDDEFVFTAPTGLPTSVSRPSIIFTGPDGSQEVGGDKQITYR